MIKIENLSKIFNKNQKNEFKVLDNISLEINEGEIIAITGKSGAGKSTLLHILACIDTYDSGNYFFDNTDINKLKNKQICEFRNQSIGIVLQDFALIDEFDVINNVMIPLSFSKKYRGIKKYERARKVLKAVGISHLEDNDVRTLSGGEKQRVAIARAIANNPKYIFADEPTGSLDSKTSEEILNLLMSLNKQGITVIIITHSNLVAEKCDRIIQISDGKIIKRIV